MRSIFWDCAISSESAPTQNSRTVHEQVGVEGRGEKIIAEIRVAVDVPPTAGERVVSKTPRDAPPGVQCAGDFRP